MKKVYDLADNLQHMLPQVDLFVIRNKTTKLFKKTGSAGLMCAGTNGMAAYVLGSIRRMMPSYDPQSLWPEEMNRFWNHWEILRVCWATQTVVVYTDKVTFYRDHPLRHATKHAQILESFDICSECGHTKS